MALDKKKGPANAKPTSGSKAAGGKKAAGKGQAASQGKQYIIAGVLIVSILAMLVRLYFKMSGSSTPQPIEIRQAQPEMPAAASPPNPSAVNPQPGMPAMAQPSAPIPTVAPVKVPDMPIEGKELLANVEDYLRQYDEAVKAGSWDPLASWAARKGLLVESLRASATAGKKVKVPPAGSHQRMLISVANTGWTLITQPEFEKTYAKKGSPPDYSYSQIVNDMNEIQPGGGISNLSRLATLLVQADCPKGRELYQSAIKDKEFYGLLVRNLHQACLDDVTPETVWQSSWYQATPMNLWLIEQLIKHNPTAAEAAGAKAEATPTLGAGAPGMPPGAMPGSPGAPTAASQMLFEHRLMLLQILSRRGGEVSSYLIGKLLEADKEDVLMNGLAGGKVDPNLFARYTEVLAEPLVGPFAQGLERHKGQQEWPMLASVVGRMLNDRACSVVLAGVTAGSSLSGDLVFLLAAGGDGETLTHLSDFIKANRVQGVEVEKVFALWTQVPSGGRQTLWGLLGSYLPSPNSAGKSPEGVPTASALAPAPGLNPGLIGPPGMPPGMPPGPGMMPGGPPMGPGMAPGGPGMPPGAPMPMAGPAPMPQFTGPSPQVTGPAGLPTRGRPVARQFLDTVDAPSALEFLKLLGQIKTAGAGNAGPGMGQNPTPVTETGKIRLSALRCLISLYNPKLRDYFRDLLGDPDAEGLARLALCTLDDESSGAALLKRFWKTPLELSRPVSAGAPGGEQVVVEAERVSVPLDAMGLPQYGITARDALVYFDYREAGKAFLSSLGGFITRKEAFDEPERVAEAARVIIDALGRWAVPGGGATLADLIESAGDFGLRAQGSNPQDKNPLATRVRMKALEVLGKIGDSESMEVIVRIATYRQKDEELELAAKIALARRGYPAAADLFLDTLDPDKRAKDAAVSNTALIASIDPSLQTREDIALLGLAKTALSEGQATRVVQLVKKLGQKAEGQSVGSAELQERLVRSLLEKGQGSVLRGLAGLIAEAPQTTGDANALAGEQALYWNRFTGRELDQTFLKMIKVLDQADRFEDEEAVTAVVAAVLKREETQLVPPGTTFEQWNAKDCLVRFEGGVTAPSPALPMGGPMMMPGPGGPGMPGADLPDMEMGGRPSMPNSRFMHFVMPNGPPGGGGAPPANMAADMGQAMASSGTAANQGPALNIHLETLTRLSEQMSQDASVAGMNLVARLKDSGRLLKGLRELPFYRYLANFMLYRSGDADGRNDLVDLLSAGTESPKDKYLKFLALRQLEQLGSLDLVGVLAEATRKSTDPVTRAYLADGAMAIAAGVWTNQFAGKLPLLLDQGLVEKAAEPWRPMMETKGYDYMTCDPLAITLAALERHAPVVKWLQDMTRVQCTRSAPVTEQAMANVVQILYSLSPSGTPALLDLYVAILGQSVDMNRQKQAAELAAAKEAVKEQEKETRVARGRRGPNDRMAAPRMPAPRSVPMARGPQQPGQPVTPGPSAGMAWVYQANQITAPGLVAAIGAMKTPEAATALSQLARNRTDLLGYLALQIYGRDAKQGQVLMKQVITESGRNPLLADQSRMVITFLMARPEPEPFGYEMLGRAIGKGDPAVSQYALMILADQQKNQRVPAGVNLANLMKSALNNLGSDVRTRREAVTFILPDLAKFVNTLNDKDLDKQVERIKVVTENTPVRGGGPQRSYGGGGGGYRPVRPPGM